ncbi:PREDICTED: putative peptidyl-tRNA hydrolase PTRHD1 [Prunus mume]|uniref:peptidyl-tRNA hydrolase n=1 Tax=Prunus mume TaxID=102107 RepID=A0ABM0N5R1_PRUMU|nr:PREDICTED: putative peptidyl-tRNA hydrolase PTRHD1 [Prunus mume]
MACLVAPLRCTSSHSHLTLSFSISKAPIGFGAKLSSNAAVPTSRLVRNSMSQPAAEANSDTSKSEIPPDVLVQYVVLRRDLIDTWPTGSVVTQGCHASVSAIWFHKDDPHTLQYCSPENIDSMHKVTLEVKGEPQILNLSEKLTAGGIAHKLWIEQPENYPTCLATKPYPKSVVSAYFKKLKLCK